MGKTINLSEYVGLLKEINRLAEVDRAQIIDVPEEDAEFDLAIMIKAKPGADKWQIQRKIQDLRWKFCKEDNPITLYIEIE